MCRPLVLMCLSYMAGIPMARHILKSQGAAGSTQDITASAASGLTVDAASGIAASAASDMTVDISGSALLIAVMIAACLIFAAVCALRRLRPDMSRKRYICIFILLPVMFAAGLLNTMRASAKSPLKSYLVKSTKAELVGTLTDISVREDKYLLTVDTSEVIIDNEHLTAQKVLVYAEVTDISRFSISDTVTAQGKIYPFLKPTNPGQFDEDMYYSARNTDAKMYAQSITVKAKISGFGEDDGNTPGSSLSSGPTDGSQGGSEQEDNSQGGSERENNSQGGSEQGYNSSSGIQQLFFGFKYMLCSLRLKFLDGLNSVLPKEEAGIVYAMLTGDKGLIDKDTKELFSDGGIAHILSISALHLTLIGMGFFRLLMSCFKRLRPSVVLTIAVILAYGILTGFSVSTKRAVIMITVTLLGKFFSQAYDSLSGCALAALIILIGQPLYFYDMGFRFSFAAVIAIFLSNEILSLIQYKNKLVDTFLPSFLISVITLPISMCSYGTINLYSVIINPAVIALMAVLLVSGLFAGVLGMIYVKFGILGGLAEFAAGPVWFILRIFKGLCLIEEKLPFSQLVTGAPETIAVAVYYAVILISFVLLKRKLRARMVKESGNKGRGGQLREVIKAGKDNRRTE